MMLNLNRLYFKKLAKYSVAGKPKRRWRRCVNHLGDLGYVNANVYYETMIDDNEGAVRAVFKINTGTRGVCAAD